MTTVGAAGPGLLGRLADDSARVKAQLDAALAQQSTGKVSDAYAGLGTGLRTSLDLRPAVQHAQTWQNNIDQASSRLSVTQSALSQIGAIAQRFEAATATINTIGTSEVAGVAAEAKLALQQVAQLLNTRAGDVYVFAGQDTGTPPVPDTDPAVLGAALLASDTAKPPFSASIGQPGGAAVPQIEVGEGQTVAVGVLANANTLATSQPPTTGSYMRDIMRGLATLAGLTDGPGAQATAADTRTRLASAVGAIADEAGALGDVQAGLATRKTTLAATQTSLSQQVSNVEDVDIAAILTRVSALQTQLQSSYQVIAQVKGLSLANYI